MEVNQHVHNNKLGEPLQSAYRPLHSVKNDILRSIDDHKAVALVLLDLSAAFDTVDHTILIQRLEQVFGLEGLIGILGWFRSYLDERKQCISIKQAISDAVCLVFGVRMVPFWVPYCSSFTHVLLG